MDGNGYKKIIHRKTTVRKILPDLSQVGFMVMRNSDSSFNGASTLASKGVLYIQKPSRIRL